LKIRNSASSSSSTSSNSSSSSSSSSSPATDDLKSNTNLVSNTNLNGGSVSGALTTGRRKKSPKKPAQKCQQVIDAAENGGGDIYCQIIDNMPDFYYENIDNTTAEKSSNSEGGGEEHNLEVFDSENAEKYEEIGRKSTIEQEYEDINGSEERLTSCSDEEEDDEVVIDDYSCFDTAYLKNVLNSTKRNDPIEILPTNKSSQKSKDQLPPLPRMAQHQSSLVFSTSADATIASSLMTSHSNNNNNITTVDFDRNLNIRRSKRFVRQPVQPVLTQEISLNNNSSTSPPTTTTTNQMTKELGISSNQSPCLHKAISTPSILDKLKLTDNGGGLKLLAQEDDATDKDTQPLVLVEDKLNIQQSQQNGGLSLISSASLNTADLGKSSSLNEKKQQSNNGNFFLFEGIRNFRKYNFNNNRFINS
jgi:hypothetical protein